MSQAASTPSAPAGKLAAHTSGTRTPGVASPPGCRRSPRGCRSSGTKLKRPWPDGRTHLVLEPVAFLRRLVGIIPPPRRHLVRCAGIFGPASKARAKLRALVPATDDTAHAACPGTPHPVPPRAHRLPWAELLGRVFAQDVLACPCGGRRSVVAFVADAGHAHRLLVTLGLPPPRQPLHPPGPHPDRARLGRPRVAPGDRHAASADHPRRHAQVCPPPARPYAPSRLRLAFAAPAATIPRRPQPSPANRACISWPQPRHLVGRWHADRVEERARHIGEVVLGEPGHNGRLAGAGCTGDDDDLRGNGAAYPGFDDPVRRAWTRGCTSQYRPYCTKLAIRL